MPVHWLRLVVSFHSSLFLTDYLSALSEQGCTFLSDNDLKSLEYNLLRYNILIVSTCNESLEHI